jgi:HD superfamily phosphohydrolase
VLQAAALIHDAAIAPFGHLLEEAFDYVAIPFNHEDKWQRVAANESEVGGLSLQVYLGRESGLRNWTRKTFGVGATAAVDDILSSVHGEPPFGALIAGGFDLDNVDNVVRIAYHMGLAVDRKLPTKVASQITGAKSDRIVLTDQGLELAQEWLRLRSEVYTHLMLASGDFVGKVMLLYAFVTALEAEILQSQDWTLTDRQVLQRLQNCEDSDIRNTVDRWLLGESWSCTRLIWLRGSAPSFSEIRRFADDVSDRRTKFFAYRIKDKRHRQLRVLSSSHSETTLGASSDLWLLGLATPKRETITANRSRELAQLAAARFTCEFVGFAEETEETEPGALFANAKQATLH